VSAWPLPTKAEERGGARGAGIGWNGCGCAQSEAARAEHSAEAIALVKAQKVYRWYLAHAPAPTPPLAPTDAASRRQDADTRTAAASSSPGCTPAAAEESAGESPEGRTLT